MLGKNRKWILAAAFVVVAALLFLFRTGAPGSAPALSGNTNTRSVEHRPEIDGNVEPEEGQRIRKVRERPDVPLAPRRSKRELLAEAKRIFGQAEAARARKLTERLGIEVSSYLYVVDQPSTGEVQNVKAQIADLRKEVASGEREDFDMELQEEIASYDPYGEQERKAFLITVPMEGAQRMRMSGTIMEADNVEEVREKLISGEPFQIKEREGFVASYDGKTLERFDQLMVWEPEKTE